MVAPKNNAWGSDYWLVHCLDGKQNLLEPVIYDEDNEFPVGSMVIKGEYLTLTTQQKKKHGYVYQDYKPGAIVYHYTNLIVGTNIKLCTLFKKNRIEVWYFLTYSDHEKLMDTVSNRDDPDGVMDWMMHIICCYFPGTLTLD